MRLRIIAAGKVKQIGLRDAIDDYVQRLGRYLPVEEVEVPQGRGGKAAQAISRALPSSFELWALDAKGQQPTSEELARSLEQRMNQGVKGIAFVIGGADGLPPAILSKASVCLSLSRMTLPHRLARLVLAEQLYRALTIIRGEPYNK